MQKRSRCFNGDKRSGSVILFKEIETPREHESYSNKKGKTGAKCTINRLSSITWGIVKFARNNVSLFNIF